MPAFAFEEIISQKRKMHQSSKLWIHEAYLICLLYMKIVFMIGVLGLAGLAFKLFFRYLSLSKLCEIFIFITDF